MDQSNVMVDRADRRGDQFWSIRTKLIISFSLLFATVLLIIELVDIAGVPLISSGRWAQQRAEVFRSLNLIADLKKDRLLRWLEERRNDIHVFSDNELVEANVAVLQAAIHGFTAAGRTEAELWTLVQTEKSYQTLVKYLDHIKVTYGTYNKIQIADAGTGTIFVSTDEADLGVRVFQESFFSGALRTRDDYVSDIRLDTRSQQPVLHFSHVIENEGGEVVAVLIMDVNADDVIKPMLHTGEGLGERGEALLVNQEVRILTSLKRPLADGSIARPLAYQITAQPAVHAARGEEGIIEAEDYRGEAALAAYRYLRLPSEGGWGMVVKRDKAELFAPLQQDVTYSVLISLAGMLVLVGLTVVMANGLTRPILSLSETAEKVAAGDLKARASVTTSDEVGLLATTFNAMIQRIQYWHQELEAQVKARTAELNKERDKAQKYLNIVGVIIVAIDADQRVTLINRKGCEILGYGEEEIIGKNWFDHFLPEGDRDGVKTVFAKLIAGEIESAEYFENPVLTKNDQMRLIAWHNTVLMDETGKIIGTLSSGEDITERKWAEEIRERLNRELMDKNKELEQIVYVASHDLRSPLVNIQGFSKELAQAFKHILSGLHSEDVPPAVKERLALTLEEDVPEALQFIFASTAKMDALLSGLLRLSRLGRAALTIQELDMNKLMANIARAFEFQLKEAEATLQIEHLPSCLGDETQINQVFSNLVDNGLKYLGPNRPGIIKISGHKKEGKVVYCVADNGIGIALEHQDKIYEIFHRLDPAASSGEGLGLTIVRKILDRHGGKIWLESEPGRGSKFFVSLPPG